MSNVNPIAPGDDEPADGGRPPETSLERLLIDLFLGGHCPHPLFGRDRIDWRAECPCWPGHWLTLIRGAEHDLVVRCDAGCSTRRVLDRVRADAAGAAHLGFDLVVWGDALDEAA